MKVFFSATTHNLDEYGDKYFKIRDHIIDQGHLLVHDWLSHIKRSEKGFIKPKIIPQTEYKKSISSIHDCQLAIFESTQPSFSTGHLLTIATQNKIPTLVLWLDDSPWVRNKGMIESIESDYLELAEYNDDNMYDVINAFLNKYEQAHLRHRFNLVIDEVERQYIDWLSYNTFKSRTKIIRDLIRNRISSDEEYRNYLQKIKK